MKISDLVRPNIKSLEPYSSARTEFWGSSLALLDANENPLRKPFNRYPDPAQLELKRSLARTKSIKSEQIFIGNGSDEAIDLLIRAFCEPLRDQIIITEPTYGMYKVAANINNVKCISWPLTRDEFDLDLPGLKKINSKHPKILFICSPNNPTGNMMSTDKVMWLLKNFQGLVVIDEAYIDFATQRGFLSCLNRFKNLVILQTFSKAWGMAGLRVGVCYGSKYIIDILNKIKYPYNVNEYSQRVIRKALSNQSRFRRDVAKLITQRTWLTARLSKLKFVKKIYPSEANFILVKMKEPKKSLSIPAV